MKIAPFCYMTFFNKILCSSTFFLVFFLGRSNAFSNQLTCLSFYKEPATIEKLNAELQRHPYSSPILVISQFLRDETASIEKQYAYILGNIKKAGTNDRLGTLLETTEQLVDTINEQVRKLTEELDRKKPSQESLDKLSLEIKKCHANLGKCQDSLFAEVANADALYQQDNALRNQIDQTSAQLRQLSMGLHLLNSEAAVIGADFSSFVLLKVQSLQGYISVINVFLQKQGTQITRAALLVEHTVPELERELIKLEARNVDIGVLDAYLKRLQGPKVAEGVVHALKMDDPVARPFERTSYGEEFIKYLELNSNKIDEKTAQEKFFEILSHENRQLRRLSLADAYDIYGKLNELRISLPATHVDLSVGSRWLLNKAYYLVLHFKGITGNSFKTENGKYFDQEVFDSTQISSMQAWMKNKVKNFIILFYLTGGIFSPENKGMRREFIEFFRNDVLSSSFQQTTVPTLNSKPILNSKLLGKFFSKKVTPVELPKLPKVENMMEEISNIVASQSEKLVQHPLARPEREVEVEIFIGNRNVKFNLPKSTDF